MTPRVEIVQLDAAALCALADGDQATAERSSPVPLTPYLVGPECRWVWQRRATQVAENPVSAGWVTGVVWDPERRITVGRAGYHGPPDANGMVEVGYAIDPQYRRQGYARSALVALLRRAEREQAVTTVRASVSPANVASSNLVRSSGFVPVGEQVDPDDGLEIVYEVPVGQSASDSA